jgi:hypothetical protein
MSPRIVDARQEQAKQQLRLEIARLRRRIDGHVRATGREAKRLTSWRTYLKTFPGMSMLAGFGAGLALSAGLGAARLARWLGLRLIGRAANTAGRAVWQEIRRLWTDSTPADKAGRP